MDREVGTAMLMQAIGVMLKALGRRTLQLIALLMACALFGWAMWMRTYLGLFIAATFAAVVLWPLLLKERQGAASGE